jgi:hypothetical protein
MAHPRRLDRLNLNPSKSIRIVDVSVSEIICWFIDLPWIAFPVLGLALGFLIWIVVY